MDLMNLWSVVVAGGTGARFGGLKQLEVVAGRRVVEWATDPLVKISKGVVIVAPAERIGDFAAIFGGPKLANCRVVAGGDSRSESVRNGLAALPSDATHVLVHDAARPALTTHLVDRVVDALRGGAAAVVPVVPVTDTLRGVAGGTVDRSAFVAVQTPQGFVLEVLRQAHASENEATDDAGLVDALGLVVMHVEGEARNLKITSAEDLQIAEILLA